MSQVHYFNLHVIVFTHPPYFLGAANSTSSNRVGYKCMHTFRFLNESMTSITEHRLDLTDLNETII